jgi:hypothetical protein
VAVPTTAALTNVDHTNRRIKPRLRDILPPSWWNWVTDAPEKLQHAVCSDTQQVGISWDIANIMVFRSDSCDIVIDCDDGQRSASRRWGGGIAVPQTQRPQPL